MISPRALAGSLAMLLTAALGPSLVAPTAQGAPVPAGARPSGAVGVWHVKRLSASRYSVSWVSPHRLPTTSDRPTISGAGLVLGPSLVGRDRRTVRAILTSSVAPRPRDLHVLLSGDRLDVRGDDVARALRASPSTARQVATAAPRRRLAADPGVPGAFSIQSSDYTLPSVKLPGMSEPIEMVGHVVEPTAAAATGPRPLVLFLHGRHEACYRPGKKFVRDDSWPCKAPNKEIPSHLGYVYIQSLLASQGYTTVSVRVNGINAQDYSLPDGGAGARAAIVQRHLDYWTTIAAAHQTDLQHVVLVGHSRGGEGVDRASIEIPLSAPYRIAGQVLIAPTDFASQTAPYVPTVTILPYCDGDVSDLEGQRFTDTSRDLLPGDTSLKSSVLVMGADHNFFNTEWTPHVSVAPSFDDWGGPRKQACGTQTPQRLSAGQQRKVGATYVAGAVHLFASGQQAYLPMYDGSPVTLPSIGRAVVDSAAIGGGRDTRRPGIDASRTLPQGALTDFCTGLSNYTAQAGICGGDTGEVVTPHWPGTYERVPARRFLAMSWTSAGQTGGLSFDKPLDLSSGRLELRTIVDPAYASVGFKVRVTDTTGHSSTLTPLGGSVLASLLRGRFVTKLWAQSVLVDPAAASGVDLTQVARVDLVSTSATGRVWVADVSAAPLALAPVPATRAATVTLGRLSIPEGDKGAVTAELPFTVHGTLTSPARLAVSTAGQQPGSASRFNIDLAPGQTSGTVAIPFESNLLDDLSPATTFVTLFPVSNVMTDGYLNQLSVIDDDPTPKILVKAVKPTVKEGQVAQFRVTLAKRVDYPLGIDVEVLDQGVHQITTADVPKSWLRKHGYVDKKHPSVLYAFLFANLPRGRQVATLSIPIARDGIKEPTESLRVTIRLGRQTYIRTVYIAASPGTVPPVAG